MSVPWDLARTRQRRRLGAAAIALWATYPAWLVMGLALRVPLVWLVPLVVYLALSGALACAAYRSARACHCLACGHTWVPPTFPDAK